MPAQWWKLPVLCVFSWNVGMCVYRFDCPASQSSRDSYFLWFTLNHTGYFPFLFDFWYWLDPFIIFDLFPGCILLVTFDWSQHELKKTCLNTNVDFFFFHVFCFVLNECNCCTSSIVYFHCLAISYVFQRFRSFCQCCLVVSHVWVSAQVTCLSEKLYLT